MTNQTSGQATSPANRKPSGQWSVDVAAVRVLWRRDMLRFVRQPARILGALGQPIIFWLVIGSGMANTFRLEHSSEGYPAYFYPGVITMVALFASIFASVSVIEDRQRGFLQAVEAGPASHWGLGLGKSLASASVATVQILGFLLLAPAAGFGLGSIDWPRLLVALGASSIALSALGLAMAWRQTSVQAFHAVQMTLLVPLWVASGAMFPLPETGGLGARLLVLNPMAYLLAAVRHALYGGQVPQGVPVVASAATAQAVALALMGGALLAAVWACRRRG